MSARNELLSALGAMLPAAQFRVGFATDVPDQIDPGCLSLRAFTKDVTPGPTLGTITYALTLWMLTGKADPEEVDTFLDAGLDPMLEALLTMKHVQFVTATRGVMDETWHGYMFTLNLYATGA
jgi:hypothetical protein